MTAHKARESKDHGRIDWTTHKKEGVRLKRLMEESSEGASFPNMAKLWNGTKEDGREGGDKYLY